MAQIVYMRRGAPEPASGRGPEGATVLVNSPLKTLPVLPSILRTLGIGDAARLVLRLCRPGRFFYFVPAGRRLLHWGSITIGWCRYYSVGPNEAVFGPVETAPDQRGRGLASRSMVEAMVKLGGHGVSVFFVDTSETNHAMQRAAEKAGFSDTGARFER